MKPCAFEYAAPVTLAAALAALAAGGDDARLLAGGQSLVPIMNFRLAAPSLLIDLNRVSELAGIEARADGTIRIGAMTRHRAVENSALIKDRLPLLQTAVRYVAHVQIRNRGTIGGSLCHADPAAEWPALCLAADAMFVVASASGRRLIPAADFALGILTTALEPQEILVEILFPAAAAGQRWGFQEASRRRGDFALTGVACTVDFDGIGVVSKARIVVFGASDVPVLSLAAADILVGQPLDAGLARRAAQAAAATIAPRSDIHASSEYRTQLIETLTRRALEQAAA